MTQQSHQLKTLDISPNSTTRGIVIWLHGLGANSHDFQPLIPYFNRIAPGIRYIFPDAPIQSVTINGGMQMQAWYDISDADLAQNQDWAGIQKSSELLQSLVNDLANQHPTLPIVLAGFSQGGLIAIQTALKNNPSVVGLLVLSSYLANNALSNLDDSFSFKGSLMMMHGKSDPVVPITLATKSFEKLIPLIKNNKWQEYNMAHEIDQEQIFDISNWLDNIFRI